MIGTDSYHIIIDLTNPSDLIEITEINLNMPGQPIEPLKAKSIGHGIIRLYREFENDGENGSSDFESNPGDDTMVSILAVPTYFTATDLLGFIGEKYMSNISHIRILKSDKPNRFLVLIKFKDIMKTAEFQYHYNGKPFNAMEPETCHVVYVKSVQLKNNNTSDKTSAASDAMIPFLLQDPFTNSSATTESEVIDPHLVELPTCPVCLERMDATVTGLLTIPCQHTFHCQCLTKWKDDTCPVCRYSHNIANERVRRSATRLQQQLNIRESSSTPPSNTTTSQAQTQTQTPASLLQQSENDDASEICMECDERDNLWICLICGNVGCSRYGPAQHSLKHFIDTGHCFAMEIATSRVWDYAGDKYVHRLVTNESDGKLVELPDKDNKEVVTQNDKVDEVGFEYSQLLISQLASQREYYESLLEEQQQQQQGKPKSRRGSSILNNNPLQQQQQEQEQKLTELEIKVEDLTSKLSDFTISLIPSLKEKIQTKDEKLNKVMRELNISTSLNDALSKKIEHLNKVNETQKETIDKLTEENKGLNEQVTDLMFFLDSQEKFKNESQEVKDGTIVIQQPTTSSSLRKNRRKKK